MEAQPPNHVLRDLSVSPRFRFGQREDQDRREVTVASQVKTATENGGTEERQKKDVSSLEHKASEPKERSSPAVIKPQQREKVLAESQRGNCSTSSTASRAAIAVIIWSA